MKKTIALLLILFFGGIIAFNIANKQNQKTQTVQNDSKLVKTYKSLSPTPAIHSVKTLFIPYWSFTRNIEASDYDTLVYFGITPNSQGIDINEVGFQKMKQFQKVAPTNTTHLLAVRMINNEINSQILKDMKLQDAIISESIQNATENKFDGIVMDFEISALSFDSVINAISKFEKKFYTQSKLHNLQFSLTMYGDTYYRARPFDTSTLGKNADAVYVMAYDFSKAGGIDPGPNFPLSGKDTYGYDFETMIQDFTNHINKNKLHIIYGMFGYDWTVDNQNRSQGKAQSLTVKEIESKFAKGNCSAMQCIIKLDTTSAEEKVTYTDKLNHNHIVWIANENSAAAKQAYAKNAGLFGIGYWAYSYF